MLSTLRGGQGPRPLQAARCRRALAALLPAAALVFAPSALLPASAAAQATPRPDLIITMIVVKKLPGPPPYIVVDEATRAPGFEVKVVTKNVGDETAGQSVTDLKLEEDGETLWGKLDTVGRLTPGMYRTSTYVVDDLKANPGLLHAVATADFTMKIRESNEKNNTKTRKPPIPVIPRDWKVTTFRATLNPGGGVSITTQAASGFNYRFSRFDDSRKAFVYKAYGQINDKSDFVGGGCVGHGSTHDSQDPWPGELDIMDDLSKYTARVDTHSEPALTYTVTCTGNVQFTETWGWVNLLTWTGAHSFPSMKPDDITLSGEGDAATPAGPIKFTWDFVARVSGV
jgi:CARDB